MLKIRKKRKRSKDKTKKWKSKMMNKNREVNKKLLRPNLNKSLKTKMEN